MRGKGKRGGVQHASVIPSIDPRFDVMDRSYSLQLPEWQAACLKIKVAETLSQ